MDRRKYYAGMIPVHALKFLYVFHCLFVYLFVWSFSSHWRIFHSFVDVTIAGEGLQILTYARQL